MVSRTLMSCQAGFGVPPPVRRTLASIPGSLAEERDPPRGRASDGLRLLKT